MPDWWGAEESLWCSAGIALADLSFGALWSSSRWQQVSQEPAGAGCARLCTDNVSTHSMGIYLGVCYPLVV